MTLNRPFGSGHPQIWSHTGGATTPQGLGVNLVTKGFPVQALALAFLVVVSVGKTFHPLRTGAG